MHASLDDYIVSPAEQRRRAIDLRRKFARKPLPVEPKVAASISPDVQQPDPEEEWLSVDWTDPMRLRVSFGHDPSFDKPANSRVMAREIEAFVAEHFGVPLHKITGHGRTTDVIDARHIAMWMIREVNGMSYPQIGERFGGRDHTTVMYGVQKVRHAIKCGHVLGKIATDANLAFFRWRAGR